MNDMQVLKARIAERFPMARVEVRPRNEEEHARFTDPQHPWFMTAQQGTLEVYIEWKPGKGFGLSISDGSNDPDQEVFGSGVQEIYHDVSSTLYRVADALTTR